MNDGIKIGGNGNFEGGHHLWAKLGAKAGGSAGGNGNFEVGHAFRSSLLRKGKNPKYAKACFGKKRHSRELGFWFLGT